MNLLRSTKRLGKDLRGAVLAEFCIALVPLLTMFFSFVQLSRLAAAVPRSDRVPSIISKIVEVLSPTNPLGIKAGGEGGTTAAPATIVSAVVDALAPYGIEDMEMPVTPYRIWQAIHGKTPSAG